MITDNTKLYVQLAPDKAGVTQLQTLQQQLSIADSMRLVNESTLHLTVLHIGLVERLIHTLTAQMHIARDVLLQNIDQLADNFQQTINTLQFETVRLQSSAYDLFGERANTLVVTFASNQQLDELHTRCLSVLQQFFADCGVSDVEQFMRQDENFKHALSLRPHVTIAKGYQGALPTQTIDPIIFRIMPVVY